MSEQDYGGPNRHYDYDAEEGYDPEINGNKSIANDHLRALGQSYAEIEELKGIFEQEILKIELWHARIKEKIDKEIRYHEGSLQYYFYGLPDEVKTIDLSNGTFGRRTVRTNLKIEDKDAALKWAQDNQLDHLIKQTPSLIKAELDKHFKTNGEIPEGCDLEDEHQRYQYQPKVESRFAGPADKANVK